MADNEVITESDKLTDDLIWGTRAIADEIGKTLTETQYLIRTNAIPVGRLAPKTIFASRQQLRRRLTTKLDNPLNKTERIRDGSA